MKRIVRIAGVAVAAAATALTGSALAGGMAPQQQIDFDDTSFIPSNPPPLNVSVGGREVGWSRSGTDLPHNIHQDKRLFRSGDPEAELDVFQTDIAAGKYHYYCQVHGSKAGGMDGVVRVRPSVSASGPDTIGINWADPEAEAKHRYRVEFRRVGARKWKVWKKGTAQEGDIFGDGDPVNANPDREYQVRVKTFVKGKKKRRSGWSPRLTFSVGL